MALPNLADNIKRGVDDFKIGDFIDISEAEDFLGELPGINDIVKAISGMLGDVLKGLESFIGKIEEFIGKIMSIIQAVMDMFNLNGLFDALGLKNLKNFIFGMVSDMFGGGTLSQREGAKQTFMAGCGSYNDSLRNEFGFAINDMHMFTLMAILEAMMCNGVTDAYAVMYNLFVNSDNVGPDKSMSVSDIDKMFSKSVAPMVLNTKNNASIDVLGSIAGIPPSQNAKRYSPNIGNNVLGFLNKDKRRTKSPSELFQNVKTNISTLDNGYNKIGGVFNLSTLTGANKYKEMAGNHVRNREVIPDYSNPVASTATLTDDIFSLF